jgi:hypothetical protein
MSPDLQASSPEVVAQAGEKGRTRMVLHTLAYIAGGAAFGFAYHKIIGCSSGACPITANPYISTLYGALMGFLVGGGLGK